MSQEKDMELLRHIYGQWSEGRYWDTSYYDPEIEFVISDGFPDTGTFRGIDEMGAGFRNWMASWRDMRFQLEKLQPVRERILAIYHLTGVGKASGIEAELHGGHIWTIRDGLAVRLEVYPDRPATFEAAGIEDPDSPT
jgi:ketosteroid isomerase-like protein